MTLIIPIKFKKILEKSFIHMAEVLSYTRFINKDFKCSTIEI
jgi:hypothetical protein